MLDRAGITLNKNTIPDDPRSPVRHERGAHRHAAATTTQGMNEPEMAEIAVLIARALRHRDRRRRAGRRARRGRHPVLEVHAVLTASSADCPLDS